MGGAIKVGGATADHTRMDAPVLVPDAPVAVACDLVAETDAGTALATRAVDRAGRADVGVADTAPVPLREVLAALSIGLDVTEGMVPGHALRTTLVGMTLGAAVGLDPQQRSALFYALLLKDAGCSANAARMTWLFSADDRHLKRTGRRQDWADKKATRSYAMREIGGGMPVHRKALALLHTVKSGRFADDLVISRCERGAEIARMLEVPDASAQAISCLEERWDGLGRPLGLAGEEIPLVGRLLLLAQNVEIAWADGGPDTALELVRARRGTWFDPALADALLRLGPDAPLWADLRDVDLARIVAEHEPEELVLTLDDARLDRAAQAFARVIDAKSPFTYAHSTRVADLAVALADACGLPAEERRDLYRAGLLHDLGKLGISNRVLDKPGRLDDEEMRLVRLHPALSRQILRRAPCFRPIADLAANHHEKLDGSGYHRGVPSAHLPAADRLLAVADVYEAVTAYRPYRSPMTPQEARALLERDAGVTMCATAVEALGDLPAHLSVCAEPDERNAEAMADIAG